MKNISEQAQNKINIVGKLLDVSFGSGKLKDGRDYERATATVRVTQGYGGRTETSEIPVDIFATHFTNSGKPNPAWNTVQTLKTLDSVQTAGIDGAATVRFNGTTIHENNFVSRNSGQLITGFRINSSFLSEGHMNDIASFILDIFIMDMHPEEDREGDPTGRLIIKGGLVQYGGVLDVLEFVVEERDSVEFIERNWNINDTVTVKGRIRITSVEEKSSGSNSSWGEDIPETTTRSVRELIITKGDDTGKDEDFAYDPVEIKKACNVRKAKIEQIQLDAKSKPAATTAAPASSASKYSWE